MSQIFADFTAFWLDFHCSGLALSTKCGYLSTLRRHVWPIIGPKNLAEISPGDILACLAPLCARGQTREAQLVLVVIRAALADAQRMGLIASNPAALLRPPRHERRPTPYWTPDELARFLRSQRGAPLYPVWLLAACCGLRRGELLGLRWSDVDLREAHLTVCSQRVTVARQVVTGPPKSAAGRRTLSLAPPVRASLASLRRRNPWAVYVLCHEDGTPYSAQQLRTALDAATASCGLHHIGIHGLRHSMAAAAVAAGVELRVLQGILGHAHVSVTADIYAHVAPEVAADALDSVAKVLV